MEEIERKFLIRGELPTTPGRRIRQGYFTEEAPEVRIRISEYPGAQQEERATKAELTIKGEERGKPGEPAQRREENLKLSVTRAEELLQLCRGTVEKVRLEIDRWEIDVFEGALEGLMLAEVELEEANEPLPELPGGLELVQEVSHDPRFRNQHLALLEDPQKQELAQTPQGKRPATQPSSDRPPAGRKR